MTDTEGPPLLRPRPRRPFELPGSSSAEPSQPPTPRFEFDNATGPNSPNDPSGRSEMSKTKSILNLTSSTLFGIYAPTAYDSTRDSEPPTPWGTGAETPVRGMSIDGGRPALGLGLGPAFGTANANGAASERRKAAYTPTAVHHPPHVSPLRLAVALFMRTITLFAFGVAYGLLVSSLHDKRAIAPIKVEGLNRGSWRYLAFWGLAGVGLGSLLPWVDGRFEAADESGALRREDAQRQRSGEWNAVVRSVGAFVGVAFAIRKLPWQSTLQVSLTLALTNPILWYLLDRTKPGFTLSTLFGLAGTAFLLATNPNLVPSPASPSHVAPLNHTTSASQASASSTLAGMLSHESVGVATWIASVLFCSCVCFGSIGRLLVAPASSRMGRSSMNGVR